MRDHVKNKRGQFYLVATVIIVATILVYTGVTNYYLKKTYSTVEEVKEELDIESSHILEYGTFDDLRDFLSKYSSYLGENFELYVIMGELGELNAYKYHNGEESEYDYSQSEEKASITIEGITYSFEILPGKNFKFIVINKISEEKYVAKN